MNESELFESASHASLTFLPPSSSHELISINEILSQLVQNVVAGVVLAAVAKSALAVVVVYGLAGV